MSLNHIVKDSGLSPLLRTQFAEVKVGSLSANMAVATDGDKNLISATFPSGVPISPYICGIGQPYLTIQSAIDAAVADGHNSQTNAATVIVTSGLYTETVTMAPFVNLSGVSVAAFLKGDINGPSGGQCEIDQMTISPESAGIACSSPSSVTINDSMIAYTSGTVSSLISVSNPSANIFVNNCMLQSPPGVYSIDVSSGSLFVSGSYVFGEFTRATGGNTVFISSLLVNSWIVDGSGTQMSAIDCLLLASGSSAPSINITSQATSNMLNCGVQGNPMFSDVDGDGSGFFNRGGCLVIGGSGVIANVNAFSFPSL